MLEGKKGAILGVANKRSLAWAAATAAAREGAELVLSYQNDRLRENVAKLAETLPKAPLLLPLDVSDDAQIRSFAEAVKEKHGRLDFLLHSIAFANAEELKGHFVDTSREGFRTALEISVHSFVSVARAVAPLMEEHGGSLITLTYIGAVQVIPHYNLMGVAKAALEASVRYLAHDLGSKGIRVNAVSAGPVRTLSASAVGDFGRMLKKVEETAPLRRNVNASEVGDVVAFLAGDLSRSVTGSTIYADAGYHIMGV